MQDSVDPWNFQPMKAARIFMPHANRKTKLDPTYKLLGRNNREMTPINQKVIG